MNSKGLTIWKCVKSHFSLTFFVLFTCFSTVIQIVYYSSAPLCTQLYFGTGSPDTVDVPAFNHSHAKVDLPGSLTLLYQNVPDENTYQVCVTEYRERYFRISPPCINFKYNQTICRPQDHESCLPATLYKTGLSPIFGLSILETTSNTTLYVLMYSKSAEYDIYQISPTEFNTLSSIWYDGLGCSFKVGNLLANSSILGIVLLCCGCYCMCSCCHFKSKKRIGVLHEQQRRMREEQIELVYRRSVQKNTVEEREETNVRASTRIIVPKLNFFDSTDSLNSVGSRSSSSSHVSFQSSTQSVNSGSDSSFSAVEDTHSPPVNVAYFSHEGVVFEDYSEQTRQDPVGGE